MKIEVLGETLELLPEKALIWRERKILVFSDVHLGKAESFQALGVPIPSAVNRVDLETVAGLIERFEIQEVLILGDLIHHKSSWTEELFFTIKGFLEYFKDVKFKLLIGNHEKGSLEFLKALPIELIEGDLTIEPFTFSHGHESSEKAFTIQGHIHPVVILKDGPVRLRLPCFVLEKKSLVLPSFGSFTGGFEISPQHNTRIFAVTKKVIEI